MGIIDFLKTKGLDEALAQKYERLVSLTLDWNEKINVTAVKDPSEFMEKNIIDSLTLIGRPELASAERILDLGTGGGYPGLPLAIACPDKEFVLADAVGKKLKVIDSICEELGVANVTTVHMRAEDMARDAGFRERFDLVLSRAVASMPVLCEYCVPFVKIGGHFTAYKTDAAREEIQLAAKALSVLGAKEPVIVPDGIEGSGHVFAICEKIQTTPKAYPRKAGTPSAKPLI